MGYIDIINRYSAEHKDFISEADSYTICDEFGISHADSTFAETKDEALAAAAAIEYPVVLKIVSPDVIHKSEVNGVILGIDSQIAFEKAYDTLLSTIRGKVPGAELKGVLIQKAMFDGIEVVVGGINDSNFGPMVMFGSGGIYIEVFKDISFRMAPLDNDEALRQMEETKAFEMLKGLRGALACDTDSLARLIVNTGEMLIKIPQIDQIDFNPVLAYPNGYKVVDARIILKPAQ